MKNKVRVIDDKLKKNRQWSAVLFQLLFNDFF